MKDFYCINKSGGTTTKRCNNQCGGCGGCRVIVENRQSRTRNMSLQDNDDLWDEAENGVKQLQPDQPYGAYSYPVIMDYLKQHYQLIKRKL